MMPEAVTPTPEFIRGALSPLVNEAPGAGELGQPGVVSRGQELAVGIGRVVIQRVGPGPLRVDVASLPRLDDGGLTIARSPVRAKAPESTARYAGETCRGGAGR